MPGRLGGARRRRLWIVSAQGRRRTEDHRASLCPLARGTPSRIPRAEQVPLEATGASDRRPALRGRDTQRQGVRPNLGGARVAERRGHVQERLDRIVDAPLVDLLTATAAHFSRSHLGQRRGGLRLAVSPAWCRRHVPSGAQRLVHDRWVRWPVGQLATLLHVPLQRRGEADHVPEHARRRGSLAAGHPGDGLVRRAPYPRLARDRIARPHEPVDGPTFAANDLQRLAVLRARDGAPAVVRLLLEHRRRLPVRIVR